MTVPRERTGSVACPWVTKRQRQREGGANEVLRAGGVFYWCPMTPHGMLAAA